MPSTTTNRCNGGMADTTLKQMTKRDFTLCCITPRSDGRKSLRIPSLCLRTSAGHALSSRAAGDTAALLWWQPFVWRNAIDLQAPGLSTVVGANCRWHKPARLYPFDPDSSALPRKANLAFSNGGYYRRCGLSDNLLLEAIVVRGD